MFTIEKDIPLPTARSGRPALGQSKYPFRNMAVGDSVVLPFKASIASATASSYGKRIGSKFSVRTIDATTTRVWRVA